MTLINGNCLQVLQDYEDNTFDLLLTDPPYGIAFMGKDWDKALPDQKVWQECFRVLKEGKMAFVMCSPRQDVLSRMIISLEDAGFRTNYTSIYWTYASGFPKAANISKLIDKKNGRYFDTSVKDYLNQKRKEKGLSFHDINKYLDGATNGGGIASAYMGDKEQNELPTLENYDRLKSLLELDNRFDELIERTEAEREIIGKDGRTAKESKFNLGIQKEWDITKPATEQAKKMEGAYVGFQPKPAVEIILVVSKGKSLTWLDDCRIPYSSDKDKEQSHNDAKGFGFRSASNNQSLYEGGFKDVMLGHDPHNQKGRFPANLLVSDDVLNDGKITGAGYTGSGITHITKGSRRFSGNTYAGGKEGFQEESKILYHNDSGSYSRYFSLDSWAKTFPFLIVPKASKSERNKGLENLEPKLKNWHNYEGRDPNNPKNFIHGKNKTFMQNHHPTVKPLKLMSYLITMGSREGDTVLDPFVGSGTTYLAATQLHRKAVGIELNPEYFKIAQARLVPYLSQTKLL